jgi:hypothetical protein
VRKPLDCPPQDDGLLRPLVAARAIVSAIALFFADSLKQPDGGGILATIVRPDHRHKTNLYACWVFPRRNSGERRLALAVADGLG